MRIDDRRDRAPDLSTDLSTATAPPTRSADVGKDFPEASSSHDPLELQAFYAGLHEAWGKNGPTAVDAATTTTARDAVVQQRLDAFRDRYCGPYHVDGKDVTARPMFRMAVGANLDNMKRHAAEVDAMAKKMGVDGPSLRMGYGSPAALVKVTQAFIDAGYLHGEASEKNIREMQWELGIGIDCACFTYRALEAASGANGHAALGLDYLGSEGFRGLDGNHHFAKVKPADVRPGDVLTLDPLPPETIGHNTIARSHTIADDAKKAQLGTQHGPAAKAFLAGAGPFHVIEVDSSWGTGSKPQDFGGYRRDTWIYDESSKSWGYVDPGTKRFVVSPDGPSGDKFHGAYRAKVAS